MLPARRSRRTGFTLVELLVVVAIISILLALGASATVRVIDVQRGSNTEQTVKIVSDALDRAWVAVIDKAKKETIPNNVRALFPGVDDRLLQIIYIKLRLRQEFPMSFAEALNPAPLAPLPVYTVALQGASSSPRTSESSVCLLLALQQSRSGLTFDADRLGSGAVGPGLVNGPPNAQGLQQIIDGFSNGVAFFRWPVDNLELNPGGKFGQPGHNDPSDPEGLLASSSLAPQVRALFNGTILHPLPSRGQNQPAGSFKLIPVVASAGRNGQFGFYPPPDPRFFGMQVRDQEQANDNVYSYRLRFGARGD